jgi:two-component system, cell cycle response regulator
MIEHLTAPGGAALTTTANTSEALALLRPNLPTTRALLAVSAALVQARLEQALRGEVMEIQAVPDHRSALQLASTQLYPLVLTDNLELIRELRAQESKSRGFIIYVSEGDDSSDRRAGIRAGASECIGQSASDDELQARLTAARRAAELEAALATVLDENQKLFAIDDLTRVASKRFFTRHFAREAERAARSGAGLSLILCDIDHFKTINDTLGHSAGDDMLRQFGPRLQRFLRVGVDWIARIGGEEFAVILPQIGGQLAFEVARKMREGVAVEPFDLEGVSRSVSASFGVCGVERIAPERVLVTERLLFRAADAALYRSKAVGRNRVTFAQLPEMDEVNGECACGARRP